MRTLTYGQKTPKLCSGCRFGELTVVAEQNRAGVVWTEDLDLDGTPAIDNAINSLHF